MRFTEALYRLDITSSTISYQRMRAAIQCLNYDPARQLLESTSASRRHPLLSPSDSEPRDREIILQSSYLRDVLLRGFRSPSSETSAPSFDPQQNMFAPNAHLTSWVRRYARLNPVIIPGDPDLKARGLNDTQIRAIAIMLGGMAGPIPKMSSFNEEGTSSSSESDIQNNTMIPHEGERRMALVLGPPGTGKTKTIIEAVRLLKQHFVIPVPVLLCTYTNVAVDNLVEGLVQQTSYVELPGRARPKPLQPLRIGSAGKVRPSLEPHTLDAKLATHPLAPELEKVRERISSLVKKRKELMVRIRETRKKIGSSSSASTHVHDTHRQGVPLAAVGVVGQGVGSGHTGGRAKGLAGRLEAMEADSRSLVKQVVSLKNKEFAMWCQMSADVVGAADVVCTTCITSASTALNVVDFPIVFIDEASMSTEPASLIPLMKGVSAHIVLPAFRSSFLAVAARRSHW